MGYLCASTLKGRYGCLVELFVRDHKYPSSAAKWSSNYANLFVCDREEVVSAFSHKPKVFSIGRSV